jgi:hypothetical protein
MIGEVQKSAFPYLVDISITNRCDKKCPWCYASSKPHTRGNDADGYFVESTIRKMLFGARVFEVVFGGGDPTLYHSNVEGYQTLAWLLRGYKEDGFKVSLTTRNYEWFKMPGFQDAVKLCHAIAISCESVEDLEKAGILASEIYKVRGDSSRRVTIQKILGLNCSSPLEEFLARCKELWLENVTLLGFKEFGRGKKIEAPVVDSSWIKVAANSGLNIGVDSAVVQKWGNQIVESGVPSWFLGGVEGRQTCYIDAVSQKAFPSSTSEYGESLEKMRYGHESDEFLKIFEKF